MQKKLVITRLQLDILRLKRQGHSSAYEIARILKVDPPSVYRSIKALKVVYPELKEIMKEIETTGLLEEMNEAPRLKKVVNEGTLKRAF